MLSLHANIFLYDLDLEAALFAPLQYPGCSGTRNLAHNISDLRAQVAANHRVSVGEGRVIWLFFSYNDYIFYVNYL